MNYPNAIWRTNLVPVDKGECPDHRGVPTWDDVHRTYERYEMSGLRPEVDVVADILHAHGGERHREKALSFPNYDRKGMESVNREYNAFYGRPAPAKPNVVDAEVRNPEKIMVAKSGKNSHKGVSIQSGERLRTPPSQ